MDLQLDLNKRYSFADYLTWVDDKRRELWDGFIKMMTPAPNLYHQEISSNLLRNMFTNFGKHKMKCKLFHAPFDVRFPKNNKTNNGDIFTVIQPDIVIVCDKKKLDKSGCIGAPDFIVEIISPSTAKRDMNDKFKLYEQHGVREYWIAFPHEQVIQKFVLENEKYENIGTFARGDKIPVHIFNNELVIDLNDVFEERNDDEEYEKNIIRL